MATSRSPKYVVVKRDDWDKYIDDHAGINILRIDDAIVIRKQDIFASTALYEYANAVRTALEVADDLMGLPPEERPHVAQQLTELADWFFDEAADAEEHYRGKIPD